MKIRGGWAHVFVRNESPDSERQARNEVEKMNFLIHKKILENDSRVTPLSPMRIDAQSAFSRNPDKSIWVEIVAYESGENPKDLGDPFADEFYNN